MQTRHRAGGGSQPDGYYPIGFSASRQHTDALAVCQGRLLPVTDTVRLDTVGMPATVRATDCSLRSRRADGQPVSWPDGLVIPCVAEGPDERTPCTTSWFDERLRCRPSPRAKKPHRPGPFPKVPREEQLPDTPEGE